MEKFKDHLSISSDDNDLASSSTTAAISPGRLKGKSNSLEKQYLRLTSAPNPQNVRPIKVLKMALENVKKKWIDDEQYSYACEQLKAIRQDLTVQNIHNRFAAHVYETHARIALEVGDLPEYNQCQGRLQEMRHRGIKINHDEFDCYRLLHSLLRDNKVR